MNNTKYLNKIISYNIYQHKKNKQLNMKRECNE